MRDIERQPSGGAERLLVVDRYAFDAAVRHRSDAKLELGDSVLIRGYKQIPLVAR
jgi:hypothetical protein